MPVPIIGSVAADVGSILATAGLGTVGTDLFEGNLPSTPANAVCVLESPGRPPVRTSAKTVQAERPRGSVVVRNVDYEDGYNLAYAVRKAIQGWQGTVNGNTYFDVTVDSGIFSSGRNERGEYIFSMQYSAYRGTR